MRLARAHSLGGGPRGTLSSGQSAGRLRSRSRTRLRRRPRGDSVRRPLSWPACQRCCLLSSQHSLQTGIVWPVWAKLSGRLGPPVGPSPKPKLSSRRARKKPKGPDDYDTSRHLRVCLRGRLLAAKCHHWGRIACTKRLLCGQPEATHKEGPKQTGSPTSTNTNENWRRGKHKARRSFSLESSPLPHLRPASSAAKRPPIFPVHLFVCRPLSID